MRLMVPPSRSPQSLQRAHRKAHSVQDGPAPRRRWHRHDGSRSERGASGVGLGSGLWGTVLVEGVSSQLLEIDFHVVADG